MTKFFQLVFIFNLIVISSCSSPGCTDPTATNYDSEATENDGTCVYPAFSDIIIGTWTEAQHFINGASYGTGEEISFFSDGTYSASGFTYPWHCEPCANSNDSGIWLFNDETDVLTLTSTKNQTEYCEALMMEATHYNAVQAMNLESFDDNEFKVSFNDVNCSQAVELTFQR